MAAGDKSLDYDAIRVRAERDAADTLAAEHERLEELERVIEESRQRLEQRVVEPDPAERG